MRRHLAMVTHGLPHPSSNGGMITCWGTLAGMREAGHRVTVVALAYPNDPFNTAERRALVTDLGAGLVVVPAAPPGGSSAPGQVRRAGAWVWRPGWPGLATVFPTVRLAPRLGELLGRIGPDALFAYHWDSLAAVHGLGVAPRMAGVGDPWHLPNLRRWQQARAEPTRRYVAWSLRTLAEWWRVPRLMVTLLRACDASGCFQAEAAAWLRSRGAEGCAYLRSPVADTPGSAWQERRRAWLRGDRLRILLGPSNVNATSTSAGLRLFAREVLPRLEAALGPDRFEVHVVGEGRLEPDLAALLARPSVRLRGRVEPADDELVACDIQLVPTPFVLGIRVRILIGFSFGCCVVAHRCEAANIPEMVDGENALLADDGAGLAAAVVRAVREPGLRERLGAAARKTYERYFSPEAAAAAIVGELERLAERRGRPRVGVASEVGR